MALISLVRPRSEGTKSRRWILVALGLFGAALLYGDGMITPAISVLSAIEGLTVATSAFEKLVVPITAAILVGLFFVQKHGTARVGTIFGPVTLVWFATLAILGISQIVRAPGVLWAINPLHAVRFFAENEWRGFLTLGTVFLVITGAEALYADMGHFGLKPIRRTWFVVVLPALLLNYFGQGALLLRNPAAAENPFYRMAPSWALYPLVVIATAATVIASQAVISGAFSLTRQAIQLGYLPRLEIDHTSARTIGQIYVPAVNWGLMLACLGLVFGFQSSSKLAAAYGVAVTTDMVFTTILFAVVARVRWRWALGSVALMTAAFLVIDLAFWGANLVKVPHGGWFPLVVAAIVFTIMSTWTRGRHELNAKLAEGTLDDVLFVKSLQRNPPIRVPGTAVFMDRTPAATPHALLHNLKHNKVMHERVALLTIVTEEVPHILPKERVEIHPRGIGIFRIIVHYGFMEDPDIPAVLATIKEPGLSFDPNTTTYFLGRETLVAGAVPVMSAWRSKLFAWMLRNATSAGHYFRLPPNRVVELGAQIEM